MNNSVYDFKTAIYAAGMEPPEHIEPGKMIRFAGAGKRPSNRAGWCLLFDDGLGGCFGDWSTGLTETWLAKRDHTYTQAERAAFALKMIEAKAKFHAEQKAKQTTASWRAKKIWGNSIPAPASFPYLQNKGIKPLGARLYKGLLVLPVVNINHTITSLQFIATDGTKKLLSSGQKKGCFITVARNIRNASKVIICEGWATGCTLSEDEPNAAILAAIDAGNLERVALTVRYQYPRIKIVIAGDDDRQTPDNPGATKARAAAISADALLALPQWPEDAPAHLTDFNDLALWLARGRT